MTDNENNFPKEWIQELAAQYADFLQKEWKYKKTANFFKKPGKGWQHYAGLPKKKGQNPATVNWGAACANDWMNEQSEYYEFLLWPTYIRILEHIQLNLAFYKDLKFIDNGCGTGLFSVFLKKLDIECYNHDNFTQTGNKPVDFSLKKPMGYDIHPVSRGVPTDASVLISSGIWVDNAAYTKLQNLKVMMLDSRWGTYGAPLCNRNELANLYDLSLKKNIDACDFYMNKEERIYL